MAEAGMPFVLHVGGAPLQLAKSWMNNGRPPTKDWLGGWPIEFATLHETRERVRRAAGLSLVNVRTGEGCSEYVFTDPSRNAHWNAINATRQQVPLYGPFLHSGGYGFMARLSELVDRSDDPSHARRSTLMLYEDGEPIGFAHAMHDSIRNQGLGRFSHWQDWLVFAASDNTDPNVNGHNYTYCIDY
jgi:hypothetical protein